MSELIIGARRAGKSFELAKRIHIALRKGEPCVYFAPNQRQARDFADRFGFDSKICFTIGDGRNLRGQEQKKWFIDDYFNISVKLRADLNYYAKLVDITATGTAMRIYKSHLLALVRYTKETGRITYPAMEELFVLQGGVADDIDEHFNNFLTEPSFEVHELFPHLLSSDPEAYMKWYREAAEYLPAELYQTEIKGEWRRGNE